MALMVLGAFEELERASEALGRLEAREFRPGGFSVIAPEGLRGDGRKRPRAENTHLEELLEYASEAPGLTSSGSIVAASGALAKYLDARSQAGVRGIAGALRELGATEAVAGSFAHAIETYGIVLGIAAETEERANDAGSILGESGAIEVLDLEIPSDG